MHKAFVLVCSVLFLACGVQDVYTVSDAGSDADTDSDADSDTDSDSDSDTDSDTDSDADTDTDTDDDAGTDSDTDTDTDTGEPTVCESSDDCEEGEACSLETLTCFTPTEPEDGQLWYCWDEGLTCPSYDAGMCEYTSPPNWDAAEGVPACVSSAPVCDTEYPEEPACCLKNEGEPDCLEDAFDLPD